MRVLAGGKGRVEGFGGIGGCDGGGFGEVLDVQVAVWGGVERGRLEVGGGMRACLLM